MDLTASSTPLLTRPGPTPSMVKTPKGMPVLARFRCPLAGITLALGFLLVMFDAGERIPMAAWGTARPAIAGFQSV
jgi:hypothetical protein